MTYRDDEREAAKARRGPRTYDDFARDEYNRLIRQTRNAALEEAANIAPNVPDRWTMAEAIRALKEQGDE